MVAFGNHHQRGWSSKLPEFFTSLRWQLVLRYAVLAFLASVALSGVLLFSRPEGFFGASGLSYDHFWNSDKPSTELPPGSDKPAPPGATKHPITELIAEGHTAQDNLLRRQSKDLRTAAQEYRLRRGRHPPPGFDAWFRYAQDHDAIIVESFFDRIHHDINPFWALDPNVTAERASSWRHVVRVRNGTATGVGNTEGRVPWLKLWTALVNESAPFLPDVDMPINYMDEPRIMVPWDEIDKYLAKEQAMRSLLPKEKVVKEYSGRADIDARRNSTQTYEPEWIKGPKYWELVRPACAPTSPSRDVPAISDLDGPPTVPKGWNPEFWHRGYVQNVTASMDPCIQPHLREMHASFVEPVSLSTTKELIPLFGGCKLPINNEILIPGAMYLTNDPMYSGGETHGPEWDKKNDSIVWRGVASGGRNREENWYYFQRHRLVQMLNGTTVAGIESGEEERAPSFEMPPTETYGALLSQDGGSVGSWLKNHSDAGFIELLCHPGESNCAYVRPYLHKVEGIPMVEQYKSKFMPDVDGNSFSARYRGFLLSTSLPIKATVYAEWHDDRLMPWQHYVPMDNTFQDLYGILNFFTKDKKGDDSARYIAEMGRQWAAKVLRREDMLLYVWRLLLEFARVCDERRETLGFVDDLNLNG